MTDRAGQIAAFLASAGWATATRVPLAGDASPRRYERLSFDAKRAILMDAPPELGEDVALFARLAEWLRHHGFSAPGIMAQDADKGLLLLEDLGDDLFARLMVGTPDRTAPLMKCAAQMLAALHRAPPPDALPRYTPQTLGEIVAITPDWYLRAMGMAPQSGATLATLTEQAAIGLLRGPEVVCLRDCHAENLIYLPDRKGIARVGLLDFQDAFLGHPAYDLVSLLQDARRDLSASIEADTIAHFCALTGANMGEFTAAYALLGAQRSLRILGIFARLALRDAKPQYLVHMPRLWSYLQRNLAHPALADLARYTFDTLPPPDLAQLQRITQPCR